VRASRSLRAPRGTRATHCVDTWLTDFRADVEKIDIPTLVVHGTKDRNPPLRETRQRGSKALNPNIRVVPVENGPPQHRLDLPGGRANRALLGFPRRLRCRGPAIHNPFFHVGFIVPDLDAAMEEFQVALGNRMASTDRRQSFRFSERTV